MPTARELLEQADALMRRNRQEAARVPAMPAAPTSVEVHAPPPVDLPPPIVEVAPVPDVRSPQAASVAVSRPPSDDADIPVLDDAVDETADDVPLLTDAVDEIEIDVSAPAVDEGEPSDWLTPPSEDESILGPAPPSVVLVPPAMAAAVPIVREARATDPAHAPPSPVVAPAGEPPPELEDLVPEPVDPDVTLRRAMPTLGAPPPPRAAPPEIEDLAETGATAIDDDVTWQRPIHPAPVVAPASAAAVVASFASAAPHSQEPPEPATAAVAPERPLPTGPEREALAEEIRMQVLQRIDMFTDTGLRERLGERLKPIVDRASADLVDAINQHVGEILRAYVAEAIEREIERWRSGR